MSYIKTLYARFFGPKKLVETPKECARRELIEAVELVNEKWETAYEHRLGLGLWVDWPTRELTVTEIKHQRIK